MTPVAAATHNAIDHGHTGRDQPSRPSLEPSRSYTPRGGSGNSGGDSDGGDGGSGGHDSPSTIVTDPFPHEPSIPRIIEDDDPILDYPPQKWSASAIGLAGHLYRLTDDLVYKAHVTPREAGLTEAAGGLTLRLLSRVIRKGSQPATGTKAAIMELGRRFRGREVAAPQRRGVVVDMFRLLEKLHNEVGIVHGDVKESNFLWARDGSLRIVNFSSARYIVERPSRWNSRRATEAYFTPERMRRREEALLSPNGCFTRPGDASASSHGAFAPTVFDDYYALAITLWSMYSGRMPRGHQFNQTVIWRTDLALVGDDMVRRWLKKVFRMAGCRLEWPGFVPEKRNGHLSSAMSPAGNRDLGFEMDAGDLRQSQEQEQEQARTQAQAQTGTQPIPAGPQLPSTPSLGNCAPVTPVTSPPVEDLSEEVGTTSKEVAGQ